jgi:hypothetical protein
MVYENVENSALLRMINALEYSSGKTSQSVAILDNSQGFRREIPVREIVFENDSMMLVRK